jgi:hypothetical protein
MSSLTKLQRKLGIVAVPGLTADIEKTGFDALVGYVIASGGEAIRHNYCSLGVVGDKRLEVTPDFSFPVKDSIARLTEAGATDIGIVSGSAGAILTADYLADNPTTNLRFLVNISPLFRWEDYGTPQLREAVRNGADIPCSGRRDIETGVTRVIPYSEFPRIKDIDTLKKLQVRHPKGLEVLTILGTKDKAANPATMREVHYLLGGSKQNLIELDEDHSVPSAQPYITRFVTNWINQVQG